MISALRMARSLLSPSERRQFRWLMVLVVVMALFEVAGVASVAPFLAVLSNPDVVETQPILALAYTRLGFSSPDDFLFFLGVGAFALLVTAAAVRMAGQYTLIRFAQMRRHSIGARLLEGYLGRPYEFYLDRHTGNLAKSILSEVDLLIVTVLQPSLMMLGHGATLLALAILLIVVDPVIAISAALLLIAAYGAVFLSVRGTVLRSGKRRERANGERFEAVSEGLGGIKDIKLLGREKAYLERFRRPSKTLAQEIARGTSLSDVPRYAIEAVAFGGVLLICLVLMARSGGVSGGGLDSVLPVLGLFAFAGNRMLPAVQAIYRALTQINFGAATVQTLHEDLIANAAERIPLSDEPAAPMGLRSELSLEEVTYRYPGETGAGIDTISFTLPALTTLGVVGGTGAGKTTLIDVILGLLPPSGGRIVADGVPLGPDNIRAWRAGIGYVPQEIFLLDASIAANIAMGLSGDEIDMDRVRHAAELAQIADVVVELPNGFETKIGERGIRLSGGQRQRIGIARALYHDPDIIVFDEATSALDNATEAEVMTAIDGLAGRKTMILIAHRLTTVERCDQVLVLERGRVAGLGTYDELSSSNVAFQRIARAVSAA